VKMSVQDVGIKIGGKVKANTDSGVFQNACPMRMSYVLNYSGVPIPMKSSYATVSGADKKAYMYRVNDMMDFLKATFGKPDLAVNNPRIQDFAGKRGILLIQGDGWGNARGHVTLFNGAICSDICHLSGDPENGTFTPKTASLWELP